LHHRGKRGQGRLHSREATDRPGLSFFFFFFFRFIQIFMNAVVKA
jgi:hypothetical protein